MKLIKVIIACCLAALASCCKNNTPGPEVDDRPLPIVIMHDNDVHCSAEGYVQFAGMRDAILASDTAFVVTVSSGDFLQGEFIGSYSQGSYLIDIMNSVGFDAVTIGNHEFDYGIARQMELLRMLGKDRVTCANFISTDTSQNIYARYIIKTCGAKKIAFVGVVTPGTVLSEYYSFSEGGERLPYDIPEDETISLVQTAVNDARGDGADYVILLSHLGEKTDSYTDVNTATLVGRTTGIDAVLDGHTHSVINEEFVKNAEGRDILLTQTGTKFSHFGKVTISTSGAIHSECIPDSLMAGYSSASVRRTVDSINALCSSVRMEKVGHTDFELTIYDETGQRLIRRGETNLGDLVSDALIHHGGTQISFINGGGIRTSIPAGDITFGSVVDVLPFANELVNIEITGEQLVKTLESGFSAYPSENGAFLQVGGLQFTYDAASTPHIQDLKVLEKDDTWTPISETSVYDATTTSYIIDDTATYPALEECPRIRTEYITEYNALKQYILDLGGEIPESYRTSGNRISVK